MTGAVSPRSWTETTAKLEAALLAVASLSPDCAPSGAGMPYSSLIPGIVRQLALMAPTGVRQPRTEEATATATKAELEQVAKRARALVQALEVLHRPAIDALGMSESWLAGPGGIEAQIRILAAAASNATLPELPQSAGIGAKAKIRPQAVTRVVYGHFLGLAGTKPTIRVSGGKAYGPFIELLTQVFDALDIKASPEGQAKKAIASMEKTPTEDGP